MVIAVAESGLIEEMRAFWGRSDIACCPLTLLARPGLGWLVS